MKRLYDLLSEKIVFSLNEGDKDYLLTLLIDTLNNGKISLGGLDKFLSKIIYYQQINLKNGFNLVDNKLSERLKEANNLELTKERVKEKYKIVIEYEELYNRQANDLSDLLDDWYNSIS